MNVYRCLALLLCSGAAFCPSGARAGVIGPIVDYTGSADSPISGMAGYQLTTFENGGLPAGVTASGGFVVGPGEAVDSVENIDLGHSFFSDNGAAGIRFSFSAALPGSLPTAAGLVWTDGDGGNRTFQAYDQNNNLIGTINDSTGLFYSTGGDGDGQNYRYFGATNAAGISSIFISNPSGGIEVDDLQFVVSGTPEPGTMMLVLGAGIVFAGMRRRS